MKKVVSFVLVPLMAAMLFAGCGSAAGGSSDTSAPAETAEQTASIDSIKTFGDVLALESEEKQSAFYEDTIVYVFKLGDIYYRVRAGVTKETSDALFELDFDDEDYDAKVSELISDIEIEEVENLNEQILSEEEMKALVGKTGQELLDDGWYWNGHDLATMEFWMGYGPLMYTVVFDGEVPEEEYETFEAEEGIKDMKVVSVEYNSIGDAANIE